MDHGSRITSGHSQTVGCTPKKPRTTAVRAAGLGIHRLRFSGPSVFPRKAGQSASHQIPGFHAGQAAHSRSSYVVTSDGKRFLVNMPAEEKESGAFRVVLNWPALLKR
jgi:hypothetical protein